MLKIIYFDEDSAIDYINIKDGGKKELITEKQSKDDLDANASFATSIDNKFRLLKLFNFNTSVEGGVNVEKYKEKVVKSTLSTTILTDYINTVKDENSNITEFVDFQILAIENSLTYIKLYSPYMAMLKDKAINSISEEFDVTKIDDILKNVKGYYEFEAINKNNSKEKYIFRFNIDTFKNNYKLSDLLKMDLTFYGVEVGEIYIENLDVEKEFEIYKNSIDVDDLLNKEPKENDKLKVFDIILAGVKK